MSRLDPTQIIPPGESKPPRPAVGAFVGDRYVLKSVLAQGGLGQVWLAYDQQLQRDVVIKEVRGKWSSKQEVEAQFQLEALITGRLEHPGIVPVHDLGRYPDGRAYYCMKLVQGNTLRQELAAFRSQPAGPERDEKRRSLFTALVVVCEAIAYAHWRGVLHLDLKPENIILGEYGETQVLDWGLAKLRSSQEDPAAERRLQGRVGTPRYMAPEQISCREDELSPASDIYALGVMLAEIVFADRGLRLPELGESELAAAPAELRAAVRQFPGPVRSICRKAMAEDPRQRYQDARELAREIERYLAGERVRAHREGPIPKFRRFARKRKTALAVLGVGLLLLCAWGFDRHQRWTEASRFAATALAEAVSDWQQGRHTQSLGRVRAAADRMASDSLARDRSRTLEDCVAALEAWLAFDTALERARFLSSDPHRATEAQRYCREADKLRDVVLPEAFQLERLQRERREALLELRLLQAWLATGAAELPPSAAADASTSYTLYLSGRRHQLAGRLSEAARAYEDCLAHNPGDFWAMFFLATAGERLGKLEQAVVGYTACLARQPTLPFPYINRGNSYLAMGKTELALQDYQRAQELGVQDPRASHNRGLALLGQERLEPARAAFDQALAIAPDYAESLLERARVLRQLQETQAARTDLEHLLRLQPESAAAHAERALCHLADKDLAAAARDAERACRLDPELPTAPWASGLIHAARADWVAAVRAYSQALDLDPENVRIRNNRAAAWLALGRFTEAKSDLDKVLKAQPDYALALLNRALVAIALRAPAGVLVDLRAIPPAASDAEAALQAEQYARICLQAGELLEPAAAEPIVEYCLQRLEKLLAGRSQDFREQLIHRPPLELLLRNPQTRQRLLPKGVSNPFVEEKGS